MRFVWYYTPDIIRNLFEKGINTVKMEYKLQLKANKVITNIYSLLHSIFDYKTYKHI